MVVETGVQLFRSLLEALVVPDLSDNLVSFADFTDKGSTILLTVILLVK